MKKSHLTSLLRTHVERHYSKGVVEVDPKRISDLYMCLTCRWVDNIKIDPREIGWGGMDWIDLAQNKVQWRALVNTVMTLGVP
jgi:hypothetical protein